LRKNSLHKTLLHEYREISKDHFEIIEGNLAQIPLFNQDDKTPKAVAILAEKIKGADGIIFFSPEYNYSVPGVLKNAIDWLSRVEGTPLSGKPATIIGASPGNLGTARMQYHLRQIGVFLNLHFLNKPEVMIGAAFDKIKNGKLIHEDTKNFLGKHVEKFSEFIKTMQ
tara:strand:- start:5 stop:508 length:504 start_codon:yes stop_codon:yes gene_type:complete